MKILKIKNLSPNEDPSYAKEFDSGFDLRVWIKKDTLGSILKPGTDTFQVALKPLERKLLHTGLFLDIPQGCEVQVRPRSGAAFKKGLSVLNTPGTIDSSYTGEICIVAVNLSNDIILIDDGERIAQAVLMPVYDSTMVSLVSVKEIEKVTDRGDGGFGHTGIK